ncbi:hypothetical protein ACROYT_G024373 [Oculina patagonica]
MGHTTHLHNLARTCTHANSLLPVEWQPWTAIVRIHQHSKGMLKSHIRSSTMSFTPVTNTSSIVGSLCYIKLCPLSDHLQCRPADFYLGAVFILGNIRLCQRLLRNALWDSFPRQCTEQLITTLMG